MSETTDSRWRGLAEARTTFERSRPRDAFDGHELRLRLLLSPYPTTEFPELEGTEFGMQDKKGVIIPGELLPSGHWCFEVGACARRHRETGAITFLGPYIHGPAGDEFLYLNWRKPDAPANTWIWRRKWRVTSLSWDEIAAATTTGAHFEHDGTGQAGHNTAPIDWRLAP